MNTSRLFVVTTRLENFFSSFFNPFYLDDYFRYLETMYTNSPNKLTPPHTHTHTHTTTTTTTTTPPPTPNRVKLVSDSLLRLSLRGRTLFFLVIIHR